LYSKLSESSAELKEIKSQLDRARELLSQSDKAIEYWEKRLELGFGDIGPSFRDLLKSKKIVEGGGRSSFVKKVQKNAKSKDLVGEGE